MSYKFDQKTAPEQYRAARRFATWPVTAMDQDGYTNLEEYLHSLTK